MVKEGIMEIVPIYVFKLNKEKAKEAKQKAQSGYPSYINAFTADFGEAK